ncbi:ATP-binding protein [Mycolicibacterium fortuitum]|uniref:ATP-binding protein n=1 Tax=Mycolicibacterium fortuitum TaxID=1766 RepID=UPI00355864C9
MNAIRGATAPSVSLQLAKITGHGSNRVSPKWGPVLTNILLGQLTEFGPVSLALPTSESAQQQIARAGLLFALTRHPGLAVHGTTAQTRRNLTKWSRDWTPTDFEQTLFDIPGEKDVDFPQDLGSDLVAFLNPTLSPAESSSDDVDSVIYPWLRKLLSKARINNSDIRQHVLRDISFATNELLNNVRDHARIGYHGNCALSLFATGSSASDSRIYVSVVDDGVGMPSTLQDRVVSRVSDCRLVADAFSGDLPRRHRGRGEGLSIVSRIAGKYGGTIFAATGPSSQGSVVYEFDSLGQSECGYIKDLAVQGTVIVLCLPTARIAADSKI